MGAQPTLFQKRAALRKSLADKGSNLGVLSPDGGWFSNRIEGGIGKNEVGDENGKKRKMIYADELQDTSIDTSRFNYDSDDFTENTNTKLDESGRNVGNTSNANSTVTGGDQKGKKKGLPAKNLMAERRRRKKLNDRLYMLRSVVPKISKVRMNFLALSLFLPSFMSVFHVIFSPSKIHNVIRTFPISLYQKPRFLTAPKLLQIHMNDCNSFHILVVLYFINGDVGDA